MAHLHVDPAGREVPVLGKTEFEVRREPFPLQRIARGVLLLDHVREIVLDEIRQHESVMQLGAPAREALGCVRRLPETRHEGPQQQLLRETHARVRRHLERAQLEQTEAAGRAVWRIHLVDAELGSDACCP